MSTFQLFRFLLLFKIFLCLGAVADELSKNALEGEPDQQFRFAQLLIEDDLNTAKDLLEVASYQNHIKSQKYLLSYLKKDDFRIHLFIDNVKKYEPVLEKIYSAEGLKELRIVGNSGDIETQYLFWFLYVNDMGVGKAEAYTWLKQAAGNDHPEALFNLGLLYYYGYIVPKETPRAYKLIQKSSKLGSPFASALLENKVLIF